MKFVGFDILVFLFFCKFSFFSKQWRNFLDVGAEKPEKDNIKSERIKIALQEVIVLRFDIDCPSIAFSGQPNWAAAFIHLCCLRNGPNELFFVTWRLD